MFCCRLSVHISNLLSLAPDHLLAALYHIVGGSEMLSAFLRHLLVETRPSRRLKLLAVDFLRSVSIDEYLLLAGLLMMIHC